MINWYFSPIANSKCSLKASHFGVPGWLSDHDLRVVRLSPASGSALSRESAEDSLSLPLPLPLLTLLSLSNK